MKIKGKTLLVWTVFFLALIIYIKFSANNNRLSFADDNNERQSTDSDPNYVNYFTFMDDFMDPNHNTHCDKCHTPNIPKSYKEVRGITASCVRGNDGIGEIGKCHSFEQGSSDDPLSLGRTHPVVNTEDTGDLREVPDHIKEVMPQDFHLEDGKYLTCATCHNPRRKPPTSDEPVVGGDKPISDNPKKYSTYFLREKNIDSKLCYLCHRDKF